MTRALPDARRAEILAQVPLGRYATPEEIAAAVTWSGLGRGRVRHRRGASRSTAAWAWATDCAAPDRPTEQTMRTAMTDQLGTDCSTASAC